jgi:hypothetical protein
MTFTIDDELPVDSMNACAERAQKAAPPEVVVPSKPAGQQFCVLCFLGPHSRQKSDTACVQVLGAFASADAANVFAKEVAKGSPAFDLFVVEMYKWAPINVSAENATNASWRNEHVDAMLKEYGVQHAMGSEVFMERKRLLQTQTD